MQGSGVVAYRSNWCDAVSRRCEVARARIRDVLRQKPISSLALSPMVVIVAATRTRQWWHKMTVSNLDSRSCAARGIGRKERPLFGFVANSSFSHFARRACVLLESRQRAELLSSNYSSNAPTNYNHQNSPDTTVVRPSASLFIKELRR